MTTLLNTLLSLLYPRRCPVCDGPVKPWNALICRECEPALSYIRPPRCMKCGKHIGDDGKEYCVDCTSHTHFYESGRALFAYPDVSASIARFKYHGRREYAVFYAACMVRVLGNFIRACGADAFVPVPLHKSRKRKRGYNQAEVLARELSALTGIPVCADLIGRVKKTAPMKELSAAQRQNNLKKAFNITTNVVKLNKTILVDDIYTTGSTLDAVAMELKRHGVKAVYFIALCIGEGM